MPQELERVTHHHDHNDPECPICASGKPHSEALGDLVRNLRGVVARVGWAVISVHGDETTPPRSYTVGLSSSYGHPELAISGLGHNQALSVLNGVGAEVKSGRHYDQEGANSKVIRGFDVILTKIPADAARGAFPMAAAVLQSQPSFLQIFWPDEERRFPWHPKYNSLPQGPIYGMVAA